MSDLDELEKVIRTSYLTKDGTCHDMAIAVWDAGYRLDPHPNGKSKDELIARVEELEGQLARARNLLHTAKNYFPVQDRGVIDRFLTETSKVKS